MASIEKQGMKGRLTLVLRDEHGREVDRREVDNLITDSGRNLVARLFAGKLQAVPRLTIAVGGNDTATNQADTDLKALIDRADATAEVTNNVTEVRATLKAAGGEAVQALKEAGIRIETGTGPAVLYNRVTFAVVNKGPTMELTLSWKVTF
jgi:hypothetical protein